MAVRGGEGSGVAAPAGVRRGSSREGTAASARLLRRPPLCTESRAPLRAPAEPVLGDRAQPGRAQPCPCYVSLW